MNVIKNLIPNFYIDELVSVMTDPSFPWFYTKETVYVESGPKYAITTPNTKECEMFSHGFLNQGRTTDTFSLVKPALYYIQEKTDIIATSPRRINRIKANMLLRHSDYPVDMYNTPHVDALSDSKFKTVLLYLNDSDGDTVFFNNDMSEAFRQKPEAGTAIVFDSKQYHASCPPIVNDKRLVLNFVFVSYA